MGRQQRQIWGGNLGPGRHVVADDVCASGTPDDVACGAQTGDWREPVKSDSALHHQGGRIEPEKFADAGVGRLGRDYHYTAGHQSVLHAADCVGIGRGSR